MAQDWCCHCLSVEFRIQAIPAFSPSLRQGLPIHTCLWRLTFLHLHCLLAVRDNRCISYFILLLCRFWVLQFKSSGSSGKHVSHQLGLMFFLNSFVNDPKAQLRNSPVGSPHPHRNACVFIQYNSPKVQSVL